jgi:hypothetical protein
MQAEKTFRLKNGENFKANFIILKKLVDKLDFSDLNINPKVASKAEFKLKVRTTYYKVFVQFRW